jgi:hypothetical protein
VPPEQAEQLVASLRCGLERGPSADHFGSAGEEQS